MIRMSDDFIGRHVLVVAHEQDILWFVLIRVVGILEERLNVGIRRAHLRHQGHIRLVALLVLPVC